MCFHLQYVLCDWQTKMWSIMVKFGILRDLLDEVVSLYCYRHINERQRVSDPPNSEDWRVGPKYNFDSFTILAVSRHLGFYRTANSAIRSADPENPSIEPNMEWTGCTVCEMFAFKLYRDLETGVRGLSRSSKVAPFDRAHTTLYSSSIVTMPLSLTFSEI